VGDRASYSVVLPPPRNLGAIAWCVVASFLAGLAIIGATSVGFYIVGGLFLLVGGTLGPWMLWGRERIEVVGEVMTVGAALGSAKLAHRTYDVSDIRHLRVDRVGFRGPGPASGLPRIFAWAPPVWFEYHGRTLRMAEGLSLEEATELVRQLEGVGLEAAGG